MSITQTAEVAGVYKSAVVQWAKRHGVKFHNGNSTRADVWTSEEMATLKALRAEGRTTNEIAALLGRGVWGVRHKVKARGSSNARRGPSNARRSPDQPKEIRPEGVNPSTFYNRRYNKRYPEKRAAHKAVERALVRGEMARGACEKCGNGRTHAHHDDYSRPLDVRWLCSPCHKAEHLMMAAE